MQRILLQYEMKEHDIHTNQTASIKKKNLLTHGKNKNMCTF